MSNEKNVSYIVEQKLCTSCGACFIVCKKEAINFTETVGGNVLPEVDIAKCDNCGLCREVCSGEKFSCDLIEKMPPDAFIGSAVEAYLGKAKKGDIFNNSQSGGVASALLFHALDSGFADVAVTVAMNWGDPPRAEPVLARTKEEILNSQKSKYSPVPALKALKGLKKSDKKLVFAGLPCQIHGLKNLYKLVPGLKEKIVLTIGLFCERTLSNAAIDHFMESFARELVGGKSLVFKDKNRNGYPGDIHIMSKSGQSKVISSKNRMEIKDLFTPARCRICFDKMNIFSDISLGDPWGIREADHEKGESVCVVRTKRGHDFLQEARSSLKLKDLDYKRVWDGQQIGRKKQEWHAFEDAWRKSGFPLPNYCGKIEEENSKKALREYQKKLRISFDLDSFPSREELLKSVRLRILKKRIFKCVLYPFRFILRVLRKLKRILD